MFASWFADINWLVVAATFVVCEILHRLFQALKRTPVKKDTDEKDNNKSNM